MATANTSSAQAVQTAGRLSPYGTSPVLAKTSAHTSLSPANHTPSPSPSSSFVATSAQGNADSAEMYLRDVRDESEGEERQARKKLWRSRGSLSKDSKLATNGSSSSSSHSKQYAKMGLLMDSPTQHAMPPPQWPRMASDSIQVVSEEVGGFQVVRLEKDGDVQASPPISVKSESLGSAGDQEGPTSSPDSGYGNTPDNPGGEEHLPGRARSGAVMGSQRVREDTQDSACGMMESSPRNSASPHPYLHHSASLPPVHKTGQGGVPHRTTSSAGMLRTTGQGGVQGGVPHRTTSSAGMLRTIGQSSAEEGQVRASLVPTATGDSMYNRHQQPLDSSTPSYLPSQRHSSTLPLTSSPTTTRRRRLRTTSSKQQHFSKSSELTRTKSSSSLRDDKDYFQVTDELAQENSHFSLSEALLAVIEQYKATCQEQQWLEDSYPRPSLSPSPSYSSLPTVYPTPPPSYCPASSTPPPGYSPLSQSPNTLHGAESAAYLTSWPSLSSIATIEDSLDGRGSMTRVSLLELMQSKSCDHSAESTAQRLLQHMSHGMAGAIKDMSHLSIKLPTDLIASLQTDEDLQKSVVTSSAHMRGNRDWAPPRKQIIYHIKQPSKNLQVELAAQGHRCTGCGMKVDSAHAKYFRFCNYVGKYFCQNCHTNATHIIPAFILERWSFRKLPVSNFARDLLSKFHDEPVFSVNPVQHPIYKRVGVMGQAKEVRLQLVEIRQYLRTCRHANKLNQMFDAASPWTSDLSSFSLNDFIELKAGVKLKQLRSLLCEAVSHVKSCPICQGRGFLCELCKNSDDIIFPFEATKVSICKDCRCCFHRGCFASSQAQCPRCLRIKERQAQRVAKIFLEAADDEEFGEELSVSEPSKT